MGIDFNKFGKSTVAGGGGSATTAPINPSVSGGGKIDFNKFGKAGGVNPAMVTPEPKENMALGMAKDIVRAPVTMIARPFQAAAMLAGASTESIDKFNLGGLIAPTPQGLGDIKKDVGRGVETVALGLGPVSGGASFGFGASLQQGNDVISMDTLKSTLLGAATGKVIGVIGKPIINASGKVVGTVTPKLVKDVAERGSVAVQDFMKSHELLGGIVKPLSEKITTGADFVDTGVDKMVNKTLTGAKNVFTGQYPGMKGENIAKRFERIEVDRLIEPTKTSGNTFNKSKEVLKDSQRRNIDLKKNLANNKIYADELIEEGRFATKDVADSLADETMNGGAEFLRPALQEAEAGVQRVPISEIRTRMLSKVGRVPETVLSAKQKEIFAKKIMQEYADDSIAAQFYKDGYSLTNLYDSKLQTSSKLYKEPKGGGVQSIADSETAMRKNLESKVFDEFLRKNAPKEIGLDEYFKAQESKFVTANYLRTLNGKKAPRSLFQRAVRRASQLTGATAGAQVAGPFGMFSGYQFGGIVSDTFGNMSNPVKISFLKSIGKTEPEIYAIMKEFVSEAQTRTLLRPRLSAGSKVDIGLNKTINDRGAIEMGSAFRPTTPGQRFSNDIAQNQKILNNTKQLSSGEPVLVTPNTTGTPNQPGAPYGPKPEPRIGGLDQKITDPYKRSVAEWKSSGTKKTYQKWLDDKRLFRGGEDSKVEGEIPNKLGENTTKRGTTPPLSSKKNPQKTLSETYKYESPEESMRKSFDRYKLEILEEEISKHPGKKLKKFISKKEGKFLDFKEPDRAKTPSERAKIITRNKNVMSQSEAAFDDTFLSDQFDNPDTIREAIAEYEALLEDVKTIRKNLN